MNQWDIYKSVFFSPDDKSGGGDETVEAEATQEESSEDTSADDGTKNWTKEQQAEFDKRAAALRKSAFEKGKAEAKTSLEKEQSKEKEKAEKKRLEDEGKYKEVADKAEAAKELAEIKAQEAEKKARNSEKKISFRDTVTDLEIEFVNAKAREDAFQFLNDEEIGEDFTGMEKAVKDLIKERPYLVKGDTTETNDDSKEKGKKRKDDNKEEESSLVSRFHIRRPR